MDLKSLITAQDAGVKAIPAHPALLDAATNYSPDPVVIGTRNRTPFGQREAARHLNAYGGQSDAIDWIMNCVRLITETASAADWGFQDNGVKLLNHKGADSPLDAKEAPLMLVKLFEEPNPFMSYEELIELTLIDYLLVGNSYWYKFRMNDQGQPLALYRLAPPFVKIVPGQLGVAGYQYQVPGYDPLSFTPDEIVHFRMPNPHNPYLGLGLVQGGSRMLDMELALVDTIASYYEKKAQPSMVVQSDRRVPKDVFNRLRSQLRAMYGGPKNAGALMVLESGLKYQSISPSATDAAFESLSQMSRDRIMSLFRVPGSLLGINDAGSVASKTTDDQRVFDTKTMKPLLSKIQGAITKGVVQAWGLDFVIDYDYIMPIEDRIRLASAFAAIPGVRVREVREYIGLQRLGDERDNMVLNLPGEDATATDTHAGIPDNNLQGEGGRPPNPANTAAFPAPGGALPAGSNVSRGTSLAAAASQKKSMDDILAEFDRIAEQKALPPASDTLAQRIQLADPLKSDREAAVDASTRELAASLKRAATTLERALLDEAANELDGKAIGTRLRSRLRKSSAWTTFRDAIATALERAAKSAISSAVMQQSRLGHVPSDDIDYDAIAKEVIFRAGGVRKITQNLQNSLSSKVGLALDEGQTKKAVEAAIRESIGAWNDSHAETVALTELTHAYNEGTLTVGEMLGHTHVQVFDGDDHDEPCQQANGQQWTIDHARENRLQHPRCRRAFSLVAPEEVS